MPKHWHSKQKAVEAGGTWQNSSQTIYLIILTEVGQVLMHSRYPGIAKNVGSLRDIKDDKGDFICAESNQRGG